jgi:hypothetical protein
MKNLRLTACVAGIVWSVACGPPPAPPSLPLDVEDFSLYGIPADADTAEIRLTFGDPDTMATAPSPFDAAIPLVTWVYEGFEVRFADGRAIGYMIETPGEMTARGVVVGDHTQVVARLYGEPASRTERGWTYVDTADETYLRVIDLVVESDTVRRIYVGRAVE